MYTHKFDTMEEAVIFMIDCKNECNMEIVNYIYTVTEIF